MVTSVARALLGFIWAVGTRAEAIRQTSELQPDKNKGNCGMTPLGTGFDFVGLSSTIGLIATSALSADFSSLLLSPSETTERALSQALLLLKSN